MQNFSELFFFSRGRASVAVIDGLTQAARAFLNRRRQRGRQRIGPAPPLFETPFITAADCTNNGQRFPFPAPPLDASANHPYPNAPKEACAVSFNSLAMRLEMSLMRSVVPG